MGGKLGFGCMRLPLLDAADPSSTDIAKLSQMIDLFMERGFRYFDTAYTYCDGYSESALCEALVKRYAREDFILADKLPTMLAVDSDDCRRIFDSQLKRCGTEWFDRYIIHCATARFCERAEELDCFGFAAGLKREGLVRQTGFSFHGTPELLENMLERHPEVDFVQLQINCLDWNHSTARASVCYETARRHNKPVTVMGTLKGGLLADVPVSVERMIEAVSGSGDPAAWALRFAASLEGVDYVLSGMASLADVERNTAVMRDFRPFSPEEYAIVDEVADTISAGTPVQCTACGYCIPACPERISIPELLRLYNSYSRMFGSGNYEAGYAALTEGRGSASSCAGCRCCESSCPQGLRIADWMRRVAGVFEYGLATECVR